MRPTLDTRFFTIRIILLTSVLFLIYQWMCLPWERNIRAIKRQVHQLQAEYDQKTHFLKHHKDQKQINKYPKISAQKVLRIWLVQARKSGLTLQNFLPEGPQKYRGHEWSLWTMQIKGHYPALIRFLHYIINVTPNVWVQFWSIQPHEKGDLALTLHCGGLE